MTTRERAEQLAHESTMVPEGAETVVRNIEAWFVLPEVRDALVDLSRHLSRNGYDDADIALGIAAMGRSMHAHRAPR